MSNRKEKKKSCESCGIKFGIATHKHVCKRCKAIVCSDCAKTKIEIAGYIDKKQHKICISCTEDHKYCAILRAKGNIVWAKDSLIMKQWLKNINAQYSIKIIDNNINFRESGLEDQFEASLKKESCLTDSSQFQEYISNIEAQVSSGCKHLNGSTLQMIQEAWRNINPLEVKNSIIRVLSAFFKEFPDQESFLTYKQEYIDMVMFLLIFGNESSAWRVMKEMYGIIIPIESISHVAHNDFTYGEKYLMNFLLDKIGFSIEQPECGAIYKFIQDRGIELVNAFLFNKSKRWQELLRALGIFILLNEDMIGKQYGKIEWEDMKMELNGGTKAKEFQALFDIFCYFEVSDQRQMNRFSMLEEVSQEEADIIVKMNSDNLIEENKMLKREVFQIFKVKQLIIEKDKQLEEFRQQLQTMQVNVIVQEEKKLNDKNSEFIDKDKQQGSLSVSRLQTEEKSQNNDIDLKEEKELFNSTTIVQNIHHSYITFGQQQQQNEGSTLETQEISQVSLKKQEESSESEQVQRSNIQSNKNQEYSDSSVNNVKLGDQNKLNQKNLLNQKEIEQVEVDNNFRIKSSERETQEFIEGIMMATQEKENKIKSQIEEIELLKNERMILQFQSKENEEKIKNLELKISQQQIQARTQSDNFFKEKQRCTKLEDEMERMRSEILELNQKNKNLEDNPQEQNLLNKIKSLDNFNLLLQSEKANILALNLQLQQQISSLSQSLLHQEQVHKDQQEQQQQQQLQQQQYFMKEKKQLSIINLQSLEIVPSPQTIEDISKNIGNLSNENDSAPPQNEPAQTNQQNDHNTNLESNQTLLLKNTVFSLSFLYWLFLHIVLKQ